MSFSRKVKRNLARKEYDKTKKNISFSEYWKNFCYKLRKNKIS